MRWTDPALDDLEAIHSCIAADNPGAAYNVIARIEEAASNLETFREIRRIGRRKGTRELVVAGLPYFVVYRLSASVVEVPTTMAPWPRRPTYPPQLPALVWERNHAI